MTNYCRKKILKKPGSTLDVLLKVHPGSAKKIVQKSPIQLFFFKAQPGPISLWAAGIFEDFVGI